MTQNQRKLIDEHCELVYGEKWNDFAEVVVFCHISDF